MFQVSSPPSQSRQGCPDLTKPRTSAYAAIFMVPKPNNSNCKTQIAAAILFTDPWTAGCRAALSLGHPAFSGLNSAAKAGWWLLRCHLPLESFAGFWKLIYTFRLLLPFVMITKQNIGGGQAVRESISNLRRVEFTS